MDNLEYANFLQTPRNVNFVRLSRACRHLLRTVGGRHLALWPIINHWYLPFDPIPTNVMNAKNWYFTKFGFYFRHVKCSDNFVIDTLPQVVISGWQLIVADFFLSSSHGINPCNAYYNINQFIVLKSFRRHIFGHLVIIVAWYETSTVCQRSRENCHHKIATRGEFDILEARFSHVRLTWSAHFLSQGYSYLFTRWPEAILLIDLKVVSVGSNNWIPEICENDPQSTIWTVLFLTSQFK